MHCCRVLCALLFAGGVLAGERGSPLVQVYDAQQLEAAHVSTEVLQLPDGRIMVSNLGGLLRFDGVQWLYVRHPRELGGMEFLSLGPGGRIYSSFIGDIGYFQDDATGQPVWHSLLGRVDLEPRSFGNVIAVDYDANRHGVWFSTYEYVLFIPDDGSPTRSLRVASGLIFADLVGAEYWVQGSRDFALHRVNADAQLELEPIPGGAHLPHVWSVVAGDGDYKVATQSGRIFSYRDGRIVTWVDDLQSLFQESKLQTMTRLRDGRYVIGSTLHGLIILDADGHVLDRYDGDDGIPVNRKTRNLFEDRDGGLWLAQDRTIVRLDLTRAVTVYDESRGLASASDAKRWRGVLYASSGVGLFRLRAEAGAGGGRFERVLPSMSGVSSLAVVDDQTMVVSDTGLHSVSMDEHGTLASNRFGPRGDASVLEKSRFVPGRVWAAHREGVLRLDRGAAGTFTTTPVPLLSTAIYRISELDANTLWVADRVDGVWRVDIHGARAPRKYGIAQGLPEGTVRIYSGHHQSWFTTTQGLRHYNAASDRFVPPSGLAGSLLTDRLYCAYEDFEGNLWVRGGAIINDVFWNEPGGWRQDGTLLHAVDPHPTIFNFLREGNIVWAIRANGLLRYDLGQRRPLSDPIAPLLTQVHDARAKANVAFEDLSALGATVRDLRFAFAAPSMHRPDAITYRSRLLGYDDWSEWGGSDATRRVYTNLPDGSFQLEVEARDSLLRLAVMAPRLVAVIPPWWRSSYMRAAYIAGAVLALWLAARLGSRRRQNQLLVRQHELEAVVETRTYQLTQSSQALQQKNMELAEQAERLTEVDRLKTRFFVNVGHEFRTPLTLVMGPIDDLLRDARERFSTRAREQLEMAHRNARRVLDLIVELLDVNRFEYGQMRLALARTDLQVLAQRVLNDLAPLLERYGHRSTLAVASDGQLLTMIDPTQIERCLSNLIGNAAKYMARGGLIEVQLRRLGAEIELAVVDQGRGIAPAALPHVYDRFFQAEGSDSASGYGIGLALVREIIEAHRGRVGVESVLGVGSTFVMTLPGLEANAQDAPVAPIPQSPLVGLPIRHPLERDEAEASARPLVLVVDDHDDLRARARGLLEDCYEVIEAADGPSAWNVARDRLPDLMVCDVMMPGFDGIELTRRLRADAETAAIAVLLLTAKVGSEHAVAGLNAGADDYLAKPFDASELLARVGALLARAQRLRLRLVREQLPSAAAPLEETADQRWRRRLDEVITQHLDDPEFSVELMAKLIHADRSQLFRKCKELLAISPSEYLRDARLKRAHALLEGAAGSVSEVAYASGFDRLSSFTRAFKSRFGLLPSQVAAACKAG